MKMIRWLVGALLIAALAMAYAEWRENNRLRADNDVLRHGLGWLQEKQKAEAASQAKRRDDERARAEADSRELQRLRGEATRFQTATRDLDRLRAENQQLRGENKQLRSAPVIAAVAAPAAPPPQPADHFPRESWSFVGYATPEAGLMTAIWAMKEGKPQTYLDSLSPEEQLRMAKQWQSKSETEVVQKHQQDVAAITGVRVLGRQSVSETEIRMSVLIEGANRNETISMKRVGDGWKFGGFIRNPAK
jgi:hypothetical protein